MDSNWIATNPKQPSQRQTRNVGVVDGNVMALPLSEVSREGTNYSYRRAF